MYICPQVGYDYMMNLEGHDITKTKGVVKDKTKEKYVKKYYDTVRPLLHSSVLNLSHVTGMTGFDVHFLFQEAEKLTFMYHQAVTCMRVLLDMSQQALGYMERKFSDIIRNASMVRTSVHVATAKFVGRSAFFSHRVHAPKLLTFSGGDRSGLSKGDPEIEGDKGVRRGKKPDPDQPEGESIAFPQ